MAYYWKRIFKSIAPLFLRSKKKKGEKRKTFNVKTIKSLSPKSKCYWLSHYRASRIQRLFLSASHGGQEYFLVLHSPSTIKSISPAPARHYTYGKSSSINQLKWLYRDVKQYENNLISRTINHQNTNFIAI